MNRVWSALALCVAWSCLGCDSKEASEPGPSAASVQSAIAPAGQARFTVGAVRVGQRRSVKRSSHSDMSVEFWADNQRWGSSEQWRHEDSTRDESVLGVVGRSAAKVRATYSVYKLKEQHPDRPRKDDALLQGNTYVIDATVVPWNIASTEASPVTAEEQERIKTLHALLGSEDPIVERLTQGEWQVAKWYSLHQRLFRALLGSDKGRYHRGRVRVARLEKLDGLDVASFEWSAQLTTQEQNGMEVEWQLEGVAIVALAPAQVLKNALTAQLKVSGRTRKDGQWIRIAGEGVVKDTTDRTTWE